MFYHPLDCLKKAFIQFKGLKNHPLLISWQEHPLQTIVIKLFLLNCNKEKNKTIVILKKTPLKHKIPHVN